MILGREIGRKNFYVKILDFSNTAFINEKWTVINSENVSSKEEKESYAIEISVNNVCLNQILLVFTKIHMKLKKEHCIDVSMLENSKACIIIVWPAIMLERKKWRNKYMIILLSIFSIPSVKHYISKHRKL